MQRREPIARKMRVRAAGCPNVAQPEQKNRQRLLIKAGNVSWQGRASTLDKALES
jgi:hypothetical protein